MILKKYNKIFRILSLIAGVFLISGCDSALLNPKGQIAVEQRSLILTAFGLMLIVVIPAILMTIIFAWKYRDSNTSAKYTPNWSHSNKVEAVVWTVPILIILFLSVLTWKSTHSLEPSKPLLSDVQPIEINVISLDWKWLFIYPKQGIATVNQIVFPANTPLNFKVTSNSVMNSFFIPTLGSQIYAMAGMQTKLHLIANEPGIFDGISSSFSGPGFSGMKFKAIATKNNAEFQQWVTKVKKSPNLLITMEDFEKLAVPSQNHPVTYFSAANSKIFKQVIDKFMTSHSQMDMIHQEGMDMSNTNSAKVEG
ncbi:cytochrome o ubiquinol oxidase subunit II [Pantoea sp. Nvir]|uniref:cytochrome o ubiquinol oxidase subunit II n=1 Tax=Pantoea sp. Nvir TaxID=2576760 RepID=UPI0027FE475E|nr:cytochrome o ubiquinol oxidase subunit II [Pantoea sp. Nvir]CAJ0993121.1 Cytochrome bo(3) ubiquinol oxidase subunit 2 [Pantoea sp. Nvir]